MPALNCETITVIGEVEVGIETNEITQLNSLLETLGDLVGLKITFDALHPSGRHAEFLNARGAHFAMTMRGNQPQLFEQLWARPWEEAPWGRIRYEILGTDEGASAGSRSPHSQVQLTSPTIHGMPK